MDQDTAQLALQFLSRTQLQGSEVAAFMRVVNALNELVKKPTEDRDHESL